MPSKPHDRDGEYSPDEDSEDEDEGADKDPVTGMIVVITISQSIRGVHIYIGRLYTPLWCGLLNILIPFHEMEGNDCISEGERASTHMRVFHIT